MNEQALVALLQTQPDRALPLLIDRYTGLVFSVLRAKTGSLARQEDLEELASDCFLALYEMRGRIDLSKGSLASLLASIAQKKAVDHLRRSAVRPQGEPLGDENILTEAVQPDPTVALTEREALVGAVRDLGEPDATIVFRKYYLRQTHKEIGDVLGLSENAVTKRLRRSLHKLQSTLKGETVHGT